MSILWGWDSLVYIVVAGAFFKAAGTLVTGFGFCYFYIDYDFGYGLWFIIETLWQKPFIFTVRINVKNIF